MRRTDHRHGEAGDPADAVRQILMEPAGQTAGQRGDNDLVAGLVGEQIPNRPHGVVFPDVTLCRRTESAHPLQSGLHSALGCHIVVERRYRRAHAALHRERLRERHDDIGAPRRRHQQCESGRSSSDPVLDHLGEVVASEGLIRDDKYSAHGPHLFR